MPPKSTRPRRKTAPTKFVDDDSIPEDTPSEAAPLENEAEILAAVEADMSSDEEDNVVDSDATDEESESSSEDGSVSDEMVDSDDEPPKRATKPKAKAAAKPSAKRGVAKPKAKTSAKPKAKAAAKPSAKRAEPKAKDAAKSSSATSKSSSTGKSETAPKKADASDERVFQVVGDVVAVDDSPEVDASKLGLEENYMGKTPMMAAKKAFIQISGSVGASCSYIFTINEVNSTKHQKTFVYRGDFIAATDDKRSSVGIRAHRGPIPGAVQQEETTEVEEVAAPPSEIPVEPTPPKVAKKRVPKRGAKKS